MKARHYVEDDYLFSPNKYLREQIGIDTVRIPNPLNCVYTRGSGNLNRIDNTVGSFLDHDAPTLFSLC